MFTPLTCVATATLAVCWAYRTYWALLWYSWRRRSCSTAVLRNLLWIRAKRLAATLSEEADIAAASGTQLSSVKIINRDHQINPDTGAWRPGGGRTCVEGPHLLQHDVVGQIQHQAGELWSSRREEQGRHHFRSCASVILKTTFNHFQPFNPTLLLLESDKAAVGV